MQDRVVALGQLIECAPAAVFGRDRIFAHPSAIGIAIEVDGGLDLGVEVVGVDGGIGIRRVTGKRCQSQGRRGKKSCQWDVTHEGAYTSHSSDEGNRGRRAVPFGNSWIGKPRVALPRCPHEATEYHRAWRGIFQRLGEAGARSPGGIARLEGGSGTGGDARCHQRSFPALSVAKRAPFLHRRRADRVVWHFLVSDRHDRARSGEWYRLGWHDRRLAAIEAQEESVRLALKSRRYNGLEERYEIRQGDFRDPALLEPDRRFDLVLGSPPYFPIGSGIESDHPQKVACRFELRGNIAHYCATAAAHLGLGGWFACVFPTEQLARVEAAAKESGLLIVRRRPIVLREEEPPLLTLFAMVRADHLPASLQTWVEPPLVIRQRNGHVHPEYAAVKLSFGFPP